MTIPEAIDILTNQNGIAAMPGRDGGKVTYTEAMRMAIASLEAWERVKEQIEHHHYDGLIQRDDETHDHWDGRIEGYYDCVDFCLKDIGKHLQEIEK